mmetsp:Transcript_4704/g.7800  ORF Transcript_4704/g.7800 Transcript_4704/m.7800 type:complete len:101 (-) Transcript_4704:40-342(-)
MSNFLCILLSFAVFQDYYQKCCGCCHSRCLSCCARCFGTSLQQDQVMKMQRALSTSQVGATVTSSDGVDSTKDQTEMTTTSEQEKTKDVTVNTETDTVPV